MEEGATNSTSLGTKKEWTAPLAFQSVSLFLLAALLEILGGWLVWQFCREKRPIWYLLLGCVVLIGYGVVPTFQPLEDFGRAYAAYGGVFIVGSYVFARIVDGFILDAGDYIGATISLVGVVIAIAWPRSGGGLSS